MQFLTLLSPFPVVSFSLILSIIKCAVLFNVNVCFRVPNSIMEIYAGLLPHQGY